ncbi:A-kinase anchor protein 13 isoform X3 [Anolis sagrei]|uniref:A-kinase anchor protein 13 isoform X3 n=1 Tax=Anolis sagrei TaxID=38937 RepID=UPI00352071F8
MKLNPQQAPLYGDCLITILLTEDDQVGNDDVVFYLVFTGSAVQHCTSTRKLDSGKLETIAPGHDCCETVKVSLCAAKQDHPILVVAEDSLQFVQDEAYDAAQFLATCAGNQQALNFTRFLDQSRPPAGDMDFLDEKLTLAFRHLKLPAEWNVLGTDRALNENVSQETLMHFAVRLGLQRLTWFLLQKPGGREALGVPNREGATPIGLALERGHQKLHQLLIEKEASEPCCWSTLSQVVHSEEYCVVKYHQGLSVYTLTTDVKKGVGPSMENDLLCLRMHIQSHRDMKPSERPHPAQPCKDCSSSTDARDHTAAPGDNLCEVVAEGNQGDPSDPLDLEAIQILVPSCFEEGPCQQEDELLDIPKVLLGLEGVENSRPSCRSEHTIAELHKEEEEGLAFAAGFKAASEERDKQLCLVNGLHGTAELPSCGCTNREVGMTSPSVVLGPDDLSDSGKLYDSANFPQEVETATPRDTKQPTSCKEGNVVMGQGECKSCTGATDVTTTAQQPVENEESDSEPSATTAVEVVSPDVATASLLGDNSAIAACQNAGDNDDDGPGEVMLPQGNELVIIDADVGPLESRRSEQTGPEISTNKNEFRKCPEDCERLGNEVQSSALEDPLAINMVGILEKSTKDDPVVEINSNGEERKDGHMNNMNPGMGDLDLSDRVQNVPPPPSAENDKPGPTYMEAVNLPASDGITSIVADGQEEQKNVELKLPGTETSSCGGSADSTPFFLGLDVAPCHIHEQGVGTDEQCSVSPLHTEPTGASELPPCFLSPAVPSLVEEQTLSKQAEMAGSDCKPDRFSKNAQEFIAAASALLVEDVIQQARLTLAQEENGQAAPAGQKASLRPEDLALPSLGKGMERLQGNLMGTPSAVHDNESKQNQEVAAETVVEAAGAKELTAVAEHGSPVCLELTTTNHSPVIGQQYFGENSSQLPESGQELPGKETASLEGLTTTTTTAVVPSPALDQVEELHVNNGNPKVGSKGEATNPVAGENVKVDEVGAHQATLVLSEDALLCDEEVPSADTVVHSQVDLDSASCGISAASGASDLMEVPLLTPCELLPGSLLQEGEEVENVPSRILLQPIAEEPPCDGDSGSEMLFVVAEGEATLVANVAPLEAVAQAHKAQGEDSQAEPQEQLLQPSPSCVVELPEQMEVHSPVPEDGNVLVDNVDHITKEPHEAPLMTESNGQLVFPAGNPMEIFPLMESEIETQDIEDTGPTTTGEGDLHLQPDGLVRKNENLGPARSSPAAEAIEMKTEEEVDASRGPTETPTSEGVINRESWCPAESSSDASLLETKHSCHSSGSYNFLEDRLTGNDTSSQGILKTGSGSVTDLFPLPGEDGMDEVDFGKQPEEEQSAGDSTSSSSSADDTISLERNSSVGSDVSLPRALSQTKDQYSPDGNPFNTAVGAEDQGGGAVVLGELEEELDSITEVPPPPSSLRNSIRPLSPFRRHSWGPGKNGSSESEVNHRSSMRLLGDGVKKPPTHRRSMSWCPLGVQCTAMGSDFNGRSYSLEGLAGEAGSMKKPSSGLETASLNAKNLRQNSLTNDERGSLVSLTEEELESEQAEMRGFDRQMHQRSQPRAFNFSTTAVSPPLTKSMSLMTITQAGPETPGRTRPSRRISFSFSISPLIPKSKTVFSIGSSSSDEEEELDSNRSFSSTGSSLTQSISEESGNFLPPSPSRKDLEGKSGTKVSRTFSYLKNKMSSSKKSKEKEKDKERIKEKDKDSKEKDKDKKTVNGHLFSATPTVGPVSCYHCMKPFNKDSFACSGCGVIVHKSCKESLAACAKVKMKLQKGGLQAHDTSSLPTVIMRSKTSQPKERPRSAILAPDESNVTSLFSNRRSQQNLALSKSVSIQNIAGVGSDESILHTWKFLSQSTDSLNKISRVNESTESLTDEGADMNEGQLMGDFESDSKQLEAQSWSQVVDSKFLHQQKGNVVKRQDVIYELMQTEMHHVRTLKIMSDVYSRGMVKDLQYEPHMVEKIFPCLDDLINIHSQFFQRILERKKESLSDRSDVNFVIKRIGDILVNQFSGENAERMKKTYGKFCGHHNEAVNYFKDLLSKDKRFQAFIKKKMSSSVVRRLGIPECILLVTQRITKYPVLLQRILQHTKENDIEHQDLVLSLNLVKEVITAVDSKVSNYEKKMRLNEIYTRTDSKSIMRMKSGQMFAREDLRRRRFVRDGPVSLKNAAGRSKEVLAVLLSDVLIFLQEKDQKYIFASLDQKSTVISLKKLIVREVAHEEKGLFLISMGGKDPEMVEVHASSKEERNSWILTIQDTINTMDKEEDEGIPSESEEEKRVLDTKARELKEQLQQKDQQIITLLEEKDKIFRDMTDCSMRHEENAGARTLFRSNTEEAPKGQSVMKNVISEVELLQGLVSRSLGSALGPQLSSLSSEQETVGPISLPRRAETFGGFDSHQMNVCKGGEKDEGDDVQDLRRTESDSVLKKGGTANLMFVLKRNNEQVLQSITHLHSLLGTLQAVVVQQDTYIEDQKLLLTERTLSRSSFRPNSLIEQEKQRSMEKQRQELANLQKQQAQHQEEKRRREREWEAREKELVEREARLTQREDQAQKEHHNLEKEREELQLKKAAYQLDLEHLRAAQKQLEKEKEQLKRDMEQFSQPHTESSFNRFSNQHAKVGRTPSMPVAEESSCRSLSASFGKQGLLDTELSVSPKRNSFSRAHKEKSSFHLSGTTASSQTNKQAEGHIPMPNRLFGLAKPKEKKEKKKKGKGHRIQPSDTHSPEAGPEGEEIFC